jgi:hypothetical protein
MIFRHVIVRLNRGVVHDPRVSWRQCSAAIPVSFLGYFGLSSSSLLPVFPRLPSFTFTNPRLRGGARVKNEKLVPFTEDSRSI